MTGALNRVLVVDDDEVVTKSFERSLPKAKYLVVTAKSGDEALSKMRDGTYDVVFTDIKMSGMSGLELTEQIKAKNSWTPVVIISGYGTKENHERANELGVAGFIDKPLSPESIEAAVEAALVAPAWGVATEETKVVGPLQVFKNAGMLVAAPFIGLGYAIAMPFVGIGALAWFGFKAVAPKLKVMGMLVAAPLIGLGYLLSMPFIGAYALGKVAFDGIKG